ncbi:MAG: hypothetical protein HUU22_15845 [Phycisphaerae bacterium]|nr:hypothetical protein [Phycisphaerae bacterium]
MYPLVAYSKCIYCAQAIDSARGQGDHIIPVQFGDFHNARRFRGACSACNNHVGRFEEQLMRCGPEALLLREFTPTLPRRRDRGKRSLSGAHGAPPPRSIAYLQDTQIPVQISLSVPGVVEPYDSLVVTYSDGCTSTVRKCLKSPENADEWEWNGVLTHPT